MSISSGLSCHPWKTRIDLPREKPCEGTEPERAEGTVGAGAAASKVDPPRARGGGRGRGGVAATKPQAEPQAKSADSNE